MRILGVSAFYHDSAAALIEDGRIVAAAQEERFTRKKHDAGFPTQAIEYCLAKAGCRLSEVDHIAFYDKPFLKFERLLETYLAFVPRGFRSFAMAMPVWLGEKLFQKDGLIRSLKAIDPDCDPMSRLLFTEHHLSHAASAFYPSPFARAAVLTIDGVGEWATTTAGYGEGKSLRIDREIRFPHSLGLLYSAFTYYCGFKVNSGEYKLMGLAPYGAPRYADLIRDHLIDIKPDGSFRLDLSYFDYCTGLTMTNARFDQLFGGPPRAPEGPVEQRHMDIAASVQVVTEEAMIALARHVTAETGCRDLVLAGGVALNCVANGRLLRDGVVDRLWVQPAAGDAGGALGAALAAHHLHLEHDRPVPSGGADAMAGAYLGPEYTTAETERRLTAVGAIFETIDNEPSLIARTAKALSEGRGVGWMQGRMEFGPRALGNRSILGDPRDPATQKNLNLKIKYRESFRPFAPAVRRDKLAEWFALDSDSPYMLLVAPVAEHRLTPAAADEPAGFERLKIVRSAIPAVTHVDGSARVQTVHPETNPRFHALLERFEVETGCPVLVNTSFNIRGEPIVCTPEDAFRCFMGCELDVLVVGDCWLEKSAQDPALKTDYRGEFDLD
ncbi:MAG: carbamoyltransferase [Alphaproteobacteria bacterium]|nr:carbamoyltransferase [Alphaproteobacteria bacterium]